MIDSYNFTYFHGKGRGEFIRYIFVQANVPYKENLIKGEDWGMVETPGLEVLLHFS